MSTTKTINDLQLFKTTGSGLGPRKLPPNTNCGSLTQMLELTLQSEPNTPPPSTPTGVGEQVIDFLTKLRVVMNENSMGCNTISESILKNAEDLVLLIIQICKLSSISDRVIAVTAFLKFKSSKPLSKTVLEKVAALLKALNNAVIHYCNPVTLQDSSGSKTEVPNAYRNLLDDWERMDDSPITAKMRELMSFCMAFSVLESCGINESFADLIYSEFRITNKTRGERRVTGFLFSFLDLLEFVMSRAKVCYTEGSLRPLFHSATSYNLWYDSVLTIKMWSRMLDCPEENGFTEHQYIHDLEEAIDKGETMQKLAKSNRDRKAFGVINSELKILRAEHLTIKRASKTRRTPFTILIPGETGVGKTYITEMLFDYFSKLRNLPMGDEYKYIRNPNDEFMSGFKSSVLYVLLDDIGFMHPNAAQSGDPSVMEMLQMVNPAPFTTNQAELEKKGKVPFLPEFIIANTNTRTMNVDKYFSHPSAVQRRFPYLIEPEVRPEYCKVSSHMLDSGKAPDSIDGVYSDLWMFSVFEIVPQALGTKGVAKRLLAREEPILRHATLYQLLEWFKGAVAKHYENQQKMLTNTQNMKSVTLCPHQFPHYMCKECGDQFKQMPNRYQEEFAMFLEDRVSLSSSDSTEPSTPEEENANMCLEDRVTLQSSSQFAIDAGPECDHCGFNCPMINMHNECHSICPHCQHCMSEEDFLFKDCLNCLLMRHRVKHLVQFELQSDTENRVSRHINVVPMKLSIPIHIGIFLYCFFFTLIFNVFSRNLFSNHYKFFMKTWHLSKLMYLRGIDEYTYTREMRNIISEIGSNTELFMLSREFVKQFAFFSLGFAITRLLIGVLLPSLGKKKEVQVENKLSPVDKESDSESCDCSDNEAAPSIIQRHFLSADLNDRNEADWKIQGNLNSQLVGQKPIPLKEKFNPWKNDKYELTVADTNRLSRSFKALSRQQIIDIIGRGLASVRIRNSDGSFNRTNSLCLCDRYYIFNSHVFSKDDEDVIMDIDFSTVQQGVTMNLSKVRIAREQIVHITGDLSLVFIPQLPPRKDLRGLLPNRSFRVKGDGIYLHRNKSGEYVPPIRVRGATRQMFHNLLIPGDVDAYHAKVDVATENGFCGSIMLLDTEHGPVFGGFHYMGAPNCEVMAHMIYTEMIEDFFKDKFVVDTGSIDLTCSNNSFELQTLHAKSPIRYCTEGVANCYGSLSGFRASHKSRVQPTLMSKYWIRERSIKVEHGPPLLKGYKPWRNGLLPMIENNFNLSWKKVDTAVNAYLNDITSALPESEGNLLEIYDFETALNGSPGVQYVDKINFNTSAGFPHNKTKKAFTTPRLDEKGRDTGFVDANPEIHEEVQKILDSYSEGERANPIFSAALKDEPRAHKKILEGKTRIFAGSPFAFTLVTRMYCGSFVRVLQRNRLTFESAVGTNTHSMDWEKIKRFLTWFGEDVFDGDYKNYDKSMMAMLIYAAALVPLKLMKKYKKVTKEEEKVYHCLAADLAYAWLNFNGDLLSFFRHNPSGHALTVIINCIVNSIYMRVAYSELSPTDKQCRDFQLYVKLITYGDDFVAGVNTLLCPWFNFANVQQVLLLIGVVLTRADKLPGSYNFKNIYDVEFLKRKFVYHEELKRHVAPLNMSSIEKSLVICVKSKSISQSHQNLAIMHSALFEMFFHGRDEFERFRDQILRYVEEADLYPYMEGRQYPTYDELLEHFREDVENKQFGVEPFALDDSLYELQDVRAVIHKGSGKGRFFRDLLKYAGKSQDKNVHPMYITQKKAKHYQGVGLRRGHLCLVEYISQKAYVDSSHCRDHDPVHCDLYTENGLSIHFHQGDPQSPYLGKEVVEFQTSDWSAYEYYWPRMRTDEAVNKTNLNEQTCGGGDASPSESAMDFAQNNWKLQSERETETPSSGDSTGNQVLLEYVDENVGSKMDFNPIKDNTFYAGYSAEASIAKFLERPVLIQSHTWAENDDVDFTIKPWLLYFDDDVIKRKITNYALLSCNLHIKIMINASPFYYGLAYATYQPLPKFVDPMSIHEDPTSRVPQVPISQRPHICLYPQCNQGGEMLLPFMYYKNWLRVNSSDEFREMGELRVTSFTTLQNANSVSTTGATIQIYAWATDVCLAAPTLSLALQSQDEYEECDGAVSGPASAVAEAGRALSRVPVIGPYAMATGFIASKIASVAKYFGFTNVPNLKDVDPFKNVPFHGMASTEISTPVEKLSFDAKNELTIDPRVLGLPPKDELSISAFVGHESWFYTANWDASDTVDTIIFTTRVVPEITRHISEVYRYATPMALLNRYFFNWRGDIVFRFRIICTKFHRGRLRITYDPDGDIVTNSVTSTTSFTKIVDISEEPDFQIRVPYMQAFSYLKTAAGENSFVQNFSVGNNVLVRDPMKDNGQLGIRVFTQQTSPVASAPIQVVVTCWGADNLEFANPGEGPQDFSSFELQGGDLEYDSPTDMEIATDDKDTNLNLVYFGEKLVNLRQLFRRTNFYMSLALAIPGGTDNAIVYNTFKIPRIPLGYGYDPHGSFQLSKLVGVGTAPANPVKQSLLSNIMKCFVAHRGSMVYHLNVDSPVELSTIEVTRATGTFSTVQPNLDGVNIASAPVVRTTYGRLFHPSGFQGRTLTNQHTQTGISVHLPMYSQFRFLATSPANVSNPTKVDGTEYDNFDVIVATKSNFYPNVERSSNLDLYYMIGTDFSLHFFLNVPTQVRYNLPTA